MVKKISSLLSRDDKKKLFQIYAIMLIHAALDLVGISIILPIINLILGGSTDNSDSAILSFMVRTTGISEENKLLILALLVLVLVYFIKAVFNIFYRYTTTKFSLDYSNELTHRLMLSYLAMPYEYHRNNSSSTLMEKTFYDIDRLICTINELLNLMIKGLTFVVIFVYLLTVSCLVTLIIVTFLIIFAVIVVRAIRPETKRISEQIQQFEANNFKYLNQAYSGIKEAKIFGTERRMSHEFYENEKKKNELILRRNIMNSLPSSFIEFVGILGICIALFVLNNVMGIDDKLIVSTFSVIVYGMIILLPIIISISSSLNNLNFYNKSVNDIYDDIEKAKEYDEIFQPEHVEDFVFSETIDFKNVSFAYQDAPDVKVLEDVSLSIKKSTVVALLGPSGSGKSTLLDLLLGLFSPSEGELTVDGKAISNNSIAWRRNISYIPQSIYLLDDTIERNIAYGCDDAEIDYERVRTALENAELYDFVQGLPKKEKTVVGENGIRLSGGQRQRIGIARALYRNAPIIISDEATSAIDYKTAEKIFRNIDRLKGNRTLIIATHREDTVKDADAIYVVDGNMVELK